MAFDSIPVVEDYQFYIDLAFNRAKKSSGRVRGSMKRKDREDKARKTEMARISTVMDILGSRLFQIVEGFPSIDGMSPFYNELVKITLNYDEVKKSLGAIHWAAKNVKKLGGQYNNKVKGSKTSQQMDEFRKQYYGRVSSMLKQVKKDFIIVGKARETIVNFPTVKELPTVCITGFPNVGKSTLLKKLTGAKAEIQNYAFTTKKLNFGYITIDDKKIQFIDTPGTLVRDKMNEIERLAHLAMKHAANILVYVWDPTETYSVEDQTKLFKEIKKLKKTIVEYVSKTDIANEEKIKNLKRKKFISDPKELLETISDSL